MRESKLKEESICALAKMEHSYQEYSPHLIHHILQQYKPRVRGCGFDALATRYKIKSGGRLVKYWYDKWDGTEFSLIKHSGGDRRSILTPEEKKKHATTLHPRRPKSKRLLIWKSKAMLKRKQGRDPLLQQLKETVNHSELPPRSEKGPKKPRFVTSNFRFFRFFLCMRIFT